MKMYKSMFAFLGAVRRGEVPLACVTPKVAAKMLGVSHQAIHNRIHITESLEAWGTEDGYVFISSSSVAKAIEKQKEVKIKQGELILDLLTTGAGKGYGEDDSMQADTKGGLHGCPQ